MKLDLPLRDVFSIYTLCYTAMQYAPPEMQELNQPSITKLREQLALHHEKDLLELEGAYQLILACVNQTEPGPVH